MGTRAHQLAMYVIYQAAIQLMSAWPKVYEGEPSFEFITNAPRGMKRMC
jgi:alpha-glucosidase